MPPTSTATLKEVAELFIQDCERRKLTYHHIRTVRSRLKNFVARHGKRPLADITKDEVQEYLAKVGSPVTQVNHLRTLRSVFQYAKDIDVLPWGVRDVTLRVKTPACEMLEPEFFTPAEMRALLAAASSEPRSEHYLIAVLVLGGFAGLRCEEILRLQWGDVLLEHKMVRLSATVTKTSRRRLAEISDNAVKWLEHVKKAVGPVVPIEYRRNLHREVARITSRAGVVWKRNGLRHSFVTYAMAKARNAYEVSEQVGNSPRVLQAHYKGLVFPADATEWFNITPDSTL